MTISNKQRVRIALVSPYTGTNLGDQALQIACIDGLRERIEDVEICGVYLNPARTSRLHGIATFPITGLAVPFYANAGELFAPVDEIAANPSTAAAVTAITVSAPRWRQWLKAIPGVRRTVLVLGALVGSIVNIGRELRCLAETWRMVGRQDLVIVAGGGQIDDEWGGAWGQPYVLMRWALLARARGKPFAVASVGVGYLNESLSRKFFSRALSKAQYVSSRDRGSALLMAELLHGREPPVVFDIAAGLADAITHADAAEQATDTIGISPIAFRRTGSWPTEAQGTYENYIRLLAGFVVWLMREQRRILIFTTSGSDSAAVADLMKIVREQLPEAAQMPSIVYPRTVSELFATLSSCAAVVASRLHGVMLSHLAVKPVVAISFDRKVDAHMEQYAQQGFRLDIENFTLADLRQRLQSLLAQRAQVRSAIAAIRESQRADLRRQFDTLASMALRGQES